eukprot:TRINITY_DN2250_c0_g2_i3.p1 TRINITY_DN2250_c0_g2~~TRINITY_DN2250_c0_g2_i3.p1  ORF type:complete len:455 (-),score=111.38 TRINITY_DN2250_c0_g2_i3:183-1547(-)
MNHRSEPATLLEIRRLTQEGSDDAILIGSIDVLNAKLEEFATNLPRVKPFYAVKCNPSVELLRMLADAGCGFDCASMGEMQLILSLGVPADRIIFANPCKMPSAIIYARDNGIAMMTFDNEQELEKIASIYPAAQLVLRIATDDRNSVCRLSLKFGAHSDHWESLIQRAHDLSLNLIGVSFHVGSNCKSVSTYAGAIADARTVFDLGSKYGYHMHLLDIGGGFPGVCGNVQHSAASVSGGNVMNVEVAIDESDRVCDEDETSDESSKRGRVRDGETVIDEEALVEESITFSDISATINTTLNALFPEEEGTFIIAEPGRYIATSIFTLLTKVIAQRDKSTLYINDGVYGCFNGIYFDHLHPVPLTLSQYIRQYVKEVSCCDNTLLLPDPSEDEGTMKSCRVFGPTCDSLDLVCENAVLPDLSVGDYLVFENMGAYSIAAATAFNGFPVVKVAFV